MSDRCRCLCSCEAPQHARKSAQAGSIDSFKSRSLRSFDVEQRNLLCAGPADQLRLRPSPRVSCRRSRLRNSRNRASSYIGRKQWHHFPRLSGQRFVADSDRGVCSGLTSKKHTHRPSRFQPDPPQDKPAPTSRSIKHEITLGPPGRKQTQMRQAGNISPNKHNIGSQCDHRNRTRIRPRGCAIIVVCRAASRTACPPDTSVQLDYVARSGLLMQAVNVLCNNVNSGNRSCHRAISSAPHLASASEQQPRR